MNDYPVVIPEVVTDRLKRYLRITAAEVKAVQQWMALDLWMALGKDSEDFGPFVAERGWAEAWAACLAEVRGAGEK